MSRPHLQPRYKLLAGCAGTKETDKNLLKFLMEDAPSGSGFDCGTEFCLEKSSGNKLVFVTTYHHMNHAGYYVGWTEHKVIITPSFFCDYDMRITGKNKNDIKDYIGDVFAFWLNEMLNVGEKVSKVITQEDVTRAKLQPE